MTLWPIHWYNILRINLGLPDTARHPEFRPFWGGDILQAAEEGNVGAVGRLLQVDRQSLEQVNTDGGLLRKDRLEGWGGCYRFAAVTSPTAAAPRDGTDVTGRTWWEGGAMDFRMKFDGVRHLSWRWTSSRWEPQGGQFEGNQAHEVMKLSLLGCTASERWSCTWALTCTTLINLYWCKRAWCKVSSDIQSCSVSRLSQFWEVWSCLISS